MAVKLPSRWMHRIAQLTRTPAALKFILAAKRPRREQQRRLIELLKHNQDTDFGRQHGFKEIKTFEDYRARVPLMSSDDLRGWVRRMQAGERGVLTQDEPVFYGRSTGTSGEPKEIPIHARYQADFQRSVMIAMWFCYWRAPEAFDQKLLYFVAPRHIAKTPTGVEIGNISGYNFTRMPAQVQELYAWPYELVEVEDLETKQYLALHIAVSERVSLIAGIFPLGVLMMLRALERYAPELAQHLGDGTYPDWLKLSPAQQARFGRYKRQDAALSARLTRAASAPRDQKCAIALPELRAVFCWKASSAGLYIPELQARLGPGVKIFDTVFAATEGWCSVPMGEAEDGGPLAITSHVYEFIEEELVDAAGGDLKDLSALSALPTKLVDELEDGRRYYIILTTSAGLYRYFLGDLIEVCGMWGALPRIKFVRKHGAAYNLVGEKLVEAHVSLAVSQALTTLDLRATWFSMVPVFSQEPHYELFIELDDDEQSPERLKALADAAHQALFKVSFSWEEFSVNGDLGPLKVHQVRRGAYQAQLEAWQRQGRAIGQLKASHLVSSREKLPMLSQDEVIGAQLAAVTRSRAT